MDKDKGLAFCGLACCVCSENSDCAGCRNEGCKDKEECFQYHCCKEKGLKGCYECEQFPCHKGILNKLRIRAFSLFMKKYGEEELLSCLEVNERAGIRYHYPNSIYGDYDIPKDEEGVFKMLLGKGIIMETKRLYLRKFNVEDTEDVFALAQDEEVGPNAGWPVHTSLENTRDIIEKILMADNQFAIVLKENNKVIGAVGLQKDCHRDHPHVLELGYWIGKPYWGKGITVEAALKVMDYGFHNLNLEMISITHFDFNMRSQKVIKKLGFHYDGNLPKSAIRFDGKELNLLLYSLTKEQYIKQLSVA